MRRYLSIPLVIVLAVIVHLDWHLARSHHHRLSMEWQYHWVIGFFAFVLLLLFCSWKWPEHFLRAALLNALVGLLLGQIVEPLSEAWGYHVSVADVFTLERWRVFFEFSLAGMIGSLCGIALISNYRRVAKGREPQVK